MYYIRKLTKTFNFNRIQEIDPVEDIESDIVRQELSTLENTLSFWKCEDLNKINDTIKAIVLSTSKIATSKFVIIDSSVITAYGLEVDDSKPGKTGYKGFANHHVDICNLTYKKLGALLQMYKKVFEDEINTRQYQKKDVGDLIVEVIKDGLLNRDGLHEKLERDIISLAEKNNIVIQT